MKSDLARRLRPGVCTLRWALLGALGLAAFLPPSEGESGVALPAIKGVSFVPIDDPEVPWKAWGEEEASGFSFLFDRIGDADQAPQRLIVLFPGDPSNPCFLEPTLRTAAESKPTILIQALLEAEAPFVCGDEDPLLEILRSLRGEYGFPPEEVILVGEGARSATVLTLASNHRTEFGGVLVWEGEPGAALPLNLKETSIALLGDRRKLNAFALFLEECREHAVPIKMNTYWGGVGDYELSNDLGEILEWMSSPARMAPGRQISHASYLHRYGKYGWIWIIEALSPGQPGSVSVQWRGSGIVEARPEGIRRFRVKLDSTFEPYGRRVEFVVGRLRLPITLRRDLEAIEFEYSESRETWSARFLKFGEELSPAIVIPDRTVEFAKGEEIPGFAAFLRATTQTDCAWGERFPIAIPRQGFGQENLYRSVSPIPYVVWETSLDRVEAFDSWRQVEGGAPAEAAFAPGLRTTTLDRVEIVVRALIPFPLLDAYFQTIQTPLPAGLKVSDNFQRLLGEYLSREIFDSSAESPVAIIESREP